MRHAVAKSRPIAVLEVVTALAQLYPKTSAAIAFELGVLASSLVNAMRRRRAPNGLLAKIVDVVPSMPGAAHPPKHKTRKVRTRKAASKSRPASKSRKSATKPAAHTAPSQAEAA